MEEKFDNTKPNAIILADLTFGDTMQKTLGPYKIADVLRQQGLEVVVLHHLHVFTIKEIENFLKHLVSDKTLFVGVSNYFYWNHNKLKIQKGEDGHNNTLFTYPDSGSFLPHGKKYNQVIKSLVKKINPDCKFIVGGAAASDSEFNKDFDFVCLGFSEISIVNLVNYLMEKEPLVDYYKSLFGFTVLTNSKADGYNFTNSTMSYKKYDGVLNNDVLVIEIARGCIFQCAFCAYPLNGKKKLDYIRSKENIKKEFLDNYYRYNVTTYVFSDDTLNDTVEKCKMIYEISKELPFKLKYKAYIRLDLLTAHPETIEYLFDSGLVAAHFGIETLNKKTASVIGKGGSREKLTKTMKYIKEKYGDSVSLYGTFIFGLPYEPIESMKKTEQWLLSDDCPLDSFSIYPLSITPLTKTLGSRGFLSDIDQNYEKYGYKNLDLITLDLDQNLKSSTKYARIMNWKNEETDYETVLDMTDKFMQLAVQKINIDHGFMLASLGISIDYIIKQSTKGLNYQVINMLKLKRAAEYKTKMHTYLDIPYIDNFSPSQQVKKYKTFDNYLLENAEEYL